MTPAGLPHSDTPGSQLGCQLPRAYRRLQRPSSALDAKASTMCPSQLVTQTLNKNYKDTPPHHPQSRAAGPLQKQSDNNPHTPKQQEPTGRCQMLASTIQIPNTPPTNPHPTGNHRTEKGKEAQKNQPTPPDRPHTPAGRATGLIPQGPTACQNHHPHPAPPGSTPTHPAGTASRPRGQY
jgi:hypothetical protein